MTERIRHLLRDLEQSGINIHYEENLELAPKDADGGSIYQLYLQIMLSWSIIRHMITE